MLDSEVSGIKELENMICPGGSGGWKGVESSQVWFNKFYSTGIVTNTM